jgi:hypothetical protein
MLFLCVDNVKWQGQTPSMQFDLLLDAPNSSSHAAKSSADKSEEKVKCTASTIAVEEERHVWMQSAAPISDKIPLDLHFFER